MKMVKWPIPEKSDTFWELECTDPILHPDCFDWDSLISQESVVFLNFILSTLKANYSSLLRPSRQSIHPASDSSQSTNNILKCLSMKNLDFEWLTCLNFPKCSSKMIERWLEIKITNFSMIREDDSTSIRSSKSIGRGISCDRWSSLVFALCIENRSKRFQPPPNTSLRRQNMHKFTFKINMSILQSKPIYLFLFIWFQTHRNEIKVITWLWRI